MPEITVKVSHDVARDDRLPEALARFATTVTATRQRGVLDEVAARLRLARRHGYGGIDLFLFLLCFICQREARGLRAFQERFAPWGAQIAGLGGRSSFPKQSSISRAASCLTSEQVTEFCSWLLDAAIGESPLRTADEVMYRDGLGTRWHVMDIDGTVTCFRQRALPEDEDSPAPRRRVQPALARPGHAGRKRGDVQFSQILLQHAGSSLWLGSWVAPSNGEPRQAMAEAASLASRWRVEGQAEVLLRFDGGLSGAPSMAACREAGVHFLTRVARYEWLGTMAAQATLASAPWAPVEDSGSGPKREAIDFTCHRFVESKVAGQERRSIDEVRVVVSRFASDGTKRGAGVVIGEWQYEMYATDLPPAAWSASDVVTCYYGRCGQENRFAQKRAELGLDRTFFYHLPAQHLGCIIGLFVWNLELVAGARLVQLKPGLTPAQAAQAPAGQSAQAPDASPEGPARAANLTPQDATIAPARCDARPKGASKQQLLAACALALREWAAGPALRKWLAAHPGWTADASDPQPRCPRGEPTRTINMRREGAALYVINEVAEGTCYQCPMRPQCTRSKLPRYHKQVTLRLKPDDIDSYDGLMAIARPWSNKEPPPPAPLQLLPPPPRGLACLPHGPRAPIRPATLVPSVLRRRAREALLATSCRVRIQGGLVPSTPPAPWIAPTAPRRQHRRHTHRDNIARYGLPDSANVYVDLNGSVALRVVVGHPDRRPASTAVADPWRAG